MTVLSSRIASFIWPTLAALLLVTCCQAQLLTPAWIEVGENGAVLARVIVNAPADCPVLRVDGVAHRMKLREPTPTAFRPACELTIPRAAKSVTLRGRALPLPRANPTHVISLGDTGCRIQGGRLQNCNDPEAWPFAQIAASVADQKPQLVIHVGDYLYREDPCPAGANAMCGGTPAGDNWNAWNADFFTPASKLLAAAPWAFSRGNHEDCLRSWRGFFYYLDPRPWTTTNTCQKYSPPYVVKLGSFQLAMVDSSPVREDAMDEEQIAKYSAELSSLHVENAWLVIHHPFWGFQPIDGHSTPIPISIPLQEAWTRAQPPGINLVLSGHIHIFEFIGLGPNHPPQLVVGNGGTKMTPPITIPLNGFSLRGATVSSEESKDEFGYADMVRTGTAWHFNLKNGAGHPLISCDFAGDAESCKSVQSE